AFADRFHARVGTPPMAYLTSTRLDLAAHWLRETTLSVAEICHRLGYASMSAFDRAFKREHGVAPSTYRDGGRRRGPRAPRGGARARERSETSSAPHIGATPPASPHIPRARDHLSGFRRASRRLTVDSLSPFSRM